MKKLLLPILISLTLVSCARPDVASASNGESIETSEVNIVGLKGKFRNTTKLNVFRFREIVDEETHPHPLYVTSFPFKNFSGWGVYEDLDDNTRQFAFFNYTYEQTLTLAKDYTYHYIYSITFGNPGGDCCADMMSINVDVQGTYNYSKIDDDNYYIRLSNPLSGTETYYGASIPDLNWFGHWASKHPTPDKQIDFQLYKEINMLELDWYVRVRDIVVSFDRETPANNSVEDDLFNSNFLEYMGQFCTY